MIKEAYVSYEIAKLLKEKGFDEECFGAYTETNHRITMFVGKIKNSEYGISMYTAPTHQMACAWLREIHLIHIEAVRGYDHFFVCITKMLPFKEYAMKNDVYGKYEEAIEAALKYTLENLI